MAETVQPHPQPHPLTIRQMQERLRSAEYFGSPRHRKRLSRRARLHLIDALSRWSGTSLAILGGTAVTVAVLNGRHYPVQTALWFSLVFASLYVCRSLRSDFRRGTTKAAHPFRWRANYTSAMAVLSTALGAGVFLSLGPQASLTASLQTGCALLASVYVAAGFNIAHGRTTIATILPASLLVVANFLQTAGIAIAIFGAGAMTIAIGAGLFLASRHYQTTAAARYPRTRLLRRNANPLRANTASSGADEEAQLDAAKTVAR